jgi:hypothetical protein
VPAAVPAAAAAAPAPVAEAQPAAPPPVAHPAPYALASSAFPDATAAAAGNMVMRMKTNTRPLLCGHHFNAGCSYLLFYLLRRLPQMQSGALAPP